MLVKTLQTLSAVKEKNCILLSPKPSSWVSLLIRNGSLLQDVPNRHKARAQLLQKAVDYTRETLRITCPAAGGGRFIITGHQPIWHHCGIWAKDVAAQAFAKSVGGTCLHLSVDHDVCDTCMLLPVKDPDNNRHFEKAEIEPGLKTVPLECRPLPDAKFLKTFVEKIRQTCPDAFCSNIWANRTELSDIWHLSSIADLTTYLQSVLNVELGLDMLYLPVSKLSESDAFRSFVGSVLADADGFAACYNEALAEQSSLPKIHSAKTLQPLKIGGKKDFTELPLWLITPDNRRETLCVRTAGTNLVLGGTGSNEIGICEQQYSGNNGPQLGNFLQPSGFRLRPKAVFLTLFVRLFLADWFIHGVGGTRYEYITDHIIERYYGIKSLSFGIATATVTLPFSQLPACSTATVRDLEQQIRYLRYNPEKFIDASLRNQEAVRSLIENKNRLLRIAGSPQTAAGQKKAAWSLLAELNSRLLAYADGAGRNFAQKASALEAQRRSEQVRESREFFFGLLEEQHLRDIINSLTNIGFQELGD